MTGLFPLASFFSLPKSWVHKKWAAVYIHPLFALIPVMSFASKAAAALLGRAKYGVRDAIPLMQLLGG